MEEKQVNLDQVQEKLREVIMVALIEAILNDDREMIEKLSLISHPIALQRWN